MRTKIFSTIVLMLCIGIFSSCNSYDDDTPMSPDCGNTEVNGNEGVYFGDYKVEYSVSGSSVKNQYTTAVVMFVTKLGNDNMKFEIYPMSLYNCHWYAPEKITEFTEHLWFDNDKIVGENVSIRGALAQYTRLFQSPKEVGDIIIYNEEFWGFKQADSFMREEFNPTGQYRGTIYRAYLELNNDVDFERVSNSINTNDDSDELYWTDTETVVNVETTGTTGKLETGSTTYKTQSTIKVEAFIRDYITNYHISMWKGSKSFSTTGSTWQSTKDATSFVINKATVDANGHIYLPKTYTIQHNREGEGGIITGIWFEAQKVVKPEEIVEIELEPKPEN